MRTEADDVSLRAIRAEADHLQGNALSKQTKSKFELPSTREFQRTPQHNTKANNKTFSALHAQQLACNAFVFSHQVHGIVGVFTDCILRIQAGLR